MNIKRNIIVELDQGIKLLADVYALEDNKPKPVLIFAHGFKGFKDWGIWDLLAQEFAKAGYAFLKFNFSHNGTTLAFPLDFGDLEAFGQNNYARELTDLTAVLDQLEKGDFWPLDQLNLNQVTLIGHSRGGGTTALKAATDARVKSWIGWASVKDLAYAWKGKQALIENWRKTGVFEIKNGRTGQMMPLYYQLYEDFTKNSSQYDVEKHIRNMKKPMLLIHGTADPAVPVSVTESFAAWNKELEVQLIEGANHVFGGSHPYDREELPAPAQDLLNYSLSFLAK